MQGPNARKRHRMGTKRQQPPFSNTLPMAFPLRLTSCQKKQSGLFPTRSANSNRESNFPLERVRTGGAGTHAVEDNAGLVGAELTRASLARDDRLRIRRIDHVGGAAQPANDEAVTALRAAGQGVVNQASSRRVCGGAAAG